MSEEEVIDNLGTIARSGTKKFLETLSGDSAKDAQLIGQFGVGFYSAFIVADKVTVLSKRADAAAVRWDSDGEGQYEIQAAARRPTAAPRSFCTCAMRTRSSWNGARLRQLVRKYSDHLSIPIVLKSGESQDTLNQAKAFWTRPKSELKDEDYQAFYKHLTHDSEEARAWAHNKVEGNIEYTSLLYLPKRAPFDLFEREQKAWRAALRQARLHHGQGGRTVAAVLALHARPGRFVGSAAERVARTAAKQPHRREDQIRAGQALAWTCSRTSPPTSRRNMRISGKPSASC